GGQGFTQGTDLVELDQDGVRHAGADATLEDTGIGDEQVVAHQLDLAAEFLREQGPAVPVALVHAVLDGQDRILAAEIGEVVGEAGAVAGATFSTEFVATVFVELGSGAVEREADIRTGPEAGLGDG